MLRKNYKAISIYCIEKNFTDNCDIIIFLLIQFVECQPLPPFIDCNNRNCFKSIQAQIDRIKNQNRINPTGAPGPTGQPITSTPGTTLSPIDPNDLIMDLERFCLFRSNGEHALPANCDVFIYCSNGIGSFAFCPNGTKFNPVFLTCDYAVNHECKFDTRKFLKFMFSFQFRP